MVSKEEAREKIGELVKRYNNQKQEGKVQKYKEDNIRRYFIDPLLKYLGWDVENKKGEEEVKGEESISKGAADYALRIKGVRKLVLEAKKYGEDLDRRDPVKQTIDYGYIASVPYAILTNFERTRVFNCELEWNNLWQAQVDEIYVDQYVEDFDKLWLLLSRESIDKGKLDEYAKSRQKKAPKKPVSELLLKELMSWREKLSKNIRENNPKYSKPEIDAIVQTIIDRLIFIRTCEDRDIENEKLNEAVRTYEKANINLEKLFKKILFYYKKNYDSKLFGIHEDSIGPADQIKIDDGVLCQVINSLYYSKEGDFKYNFAAINADVLGNVYEQYLGTVLKEGEFEESKNLRKKEGIYYTPTYIVDYIVRNTLGELIKNKNLEELEKVKVLDPACGSGSFLIKAFDILYERYKQLLKKELSGKDKDLKDTEIKLKILRNNLFGVDLDERAVEIARLNLLLKAADKRFKLPTLENNIKCGNSLIDNPEVAGNKAFKWEQEFKQIIDKKGFDVVIGNPPYVRIQTLNKKEVECFNKTYKSATKNYDIYALFVEKGMSLLKEGGVLGFILPSKFFNADYGVGLRKVIGENKYLNQIVDFKDFQVFEGATTYTCLLFLKKTKNKSFDYYELNNKEKLKISKNISFDILKKSRQEQPMEESTWSFVSEDKRKVTKKLEKMKLKLGDISSELFVGLQTSADPIYIVQITKEDKKFYEIICRKTKKAYKIEKEVVKPILMGKDIKRWLINQRELGLIFPYKIENKKAILIEESSFKKQYPNAWEYFVDNKKILDLREKGKWKNRHNWHAYVYEKNLVSFSQPKILTQVLSPKNRFTLDKKGEFYFVGGGNAGGYGIILKKEYSDYYHSILAMLNSRLLEFYLKCISTPFKGGFYSYGKRFIEKLPIILPKDNIKKKLDEFAKRQLELNERLLELKEKLTDEKIRLEKEIEKLDKEIDQLVYTLYGLTPEEIKTVKESV